MWNRLRALERKLIHELAEYVVTEQVDDFTDRWREAVEEDRPAPETLDFVRDMTRAGFPLPTIPGALNYLAECWHNKSMPDPARLFQILLPWSNYAAHAWPWSRTAPQSHPKSLKGRYLRGCPPAVRQTSGFGVRPGRKFAPASRPMWG